ncbi:MAG: hypothetical protein ACAI25_02370 [Planctomycetota bacterium]
MKVGDLFTLEILLATLVTGLSQKLAANGSYTVGGVVYTRDELVKVVTEDFELFRAARESWAASRQKAHERDRRAPEVRIRLQEIRSMLNSVYGQESAELVDFGFKPKKRRARRTSESTKPDVKNPAK